MELTVKVTRHSSHLPEHLLAEIGRLTTDWAVIETNLYMHTLHLAEGKLSARLSGFTAVQKTWARLCVERFPHEVSAVSDIVDRLGRRSTARNWTVHGNWRYVSDDQIETHWLDFRRDRELGNTAHITFAGLQEQTLLLAELRVDILNLVKRTLPHYAADDRAMLANYEAVRSGAPIG